MNYIVTISSKNKNSLINFFKFFNNELLTIASHSIVISQNQKKNARKTISILKSPHVYKSAQVHYGFKKFSKQIFIFSHKPNKFFLFCKKIQSSLFPDLVMEIQSFVKFNHTTKLSSKLLNPNNFIVALENVNYRSQQIGTKRSLAIVPPLKKLLVKKKKRLDKGNLTQAYKRLSYKVVNYLKVWDCYGESNLIGFK